MTDTPKTVPKPGRKRGGSPRNVTMTFRATPGEAERIREAAGSTPLSEWLRDTALHSRGALEMLAEVHKKILSIEIAAASALELDKIKDREQSTLILLKNVLEIQKEMGSKMEELADTVRAIQASEGKADRPSDKPQSRRPS